MDSEYLLFMLYLRLHRKHLQPADLLPSYMPKLSFVLDHASFPKLPNGKPDLKALRRWRPSVKASSSWTLGQTKKASKGELFENAVIHRCYAFWMLGVPRLPALRECEGDGSDRHTF